MLKAYTFIKNQTTLSSDVFLFQIFHYRDIYTLKTNDIFPYLGRGHKDIKTNFLELKKDLYKGEFMSIATISNTNSYLKRNKKFSLNIKTKKDLLNLIQDN